MPKIPAISLISAISFLVFLFLDLVDFLLCFFYRFVDGILEENPRGCYCYCQKGGEGVSETLYGRRNVFREVGFLLLGRRRDGDERKGGLRGSRWSDCGCRACISWQEENGEERLHLVVREPAQAVNKACEPIESVIFLHGFLSSSSWWVETVFPNLSECAKNKFRMFAVDLLGFGRSPKPVDCLYTLEEHIQMIERSVLRQFQLNSFHLVAHSMGCIIALALAAKYPKSVKSITLTAPPYFSSTEVKASYTMLNRVAERKIWPPLLFGSSVMSWYEHLGRTVCFLFCRNHLKWEWIMKRITRKQDLNFMIVDLTKHTHHSAWHTMHNVICGGAKLMDKYFEVLKREGILVKLIQGNKDQVVPLECSYNMKLKIPLAELTIIPDADHSTVLQGREKDFTRDLEDFWLSSTKYEAHPFNRDKKIALVE